MPELESTISETDDDGDGDGDEESDFVATANNKLFKVRDYSILFF